MEATSLLSLPEGMLVNQIQVTENGLVIEVAATSPTSCCPLCSQPSSSIHCHYRRTLRDAPCAGRCVQFVLTVRKFSCRNPECSRKVFAERFPTLRNIRPTRLSGSLCVIPKHWMRASKRIWRPSSEPVHRSKEPTTSFKAFWPWSTSGKETT